MQPPSSNAALPAALKNELASAVKELSSALTEVAAQAYGGRGASPQQLQRAEAAKLRLHNARALLAFYVSAARRGDAADAARRASIRAR